MSDRLDEMMEMQRKLQQEAYGINPGELDMPQKIKYIKDMHMGMMSEMSELLNEITWKPWTSGDLDINGDGYRKEIVDVWHFMMNLMLAVNMTPYELYNMYVQKRAVNLRRQQNGYDGKSTKCPGCSRAVEDISINQVHIDGVTGALAFFCGTCNHRLDPEMVKSFIID